MNGKRILMLIGEYSEEYEIFVVQQALEALGHTVDRYVTFHSKYGCMSGTRLKTVEIPRSTG